MVAHASVASRKPEVECEVIHNHNRPVNVYSYDPKDGHRSAKTVDATVGYQDLQSGQKFILMMNLASDRWISQPSFMPHAVLSEWDAYQLSPQVLSRDS